MNHWMGLIALSIGFLTINGTAQAQSTVTTTGGTANAVPKFSGSSTLVNSAITESNGNVGIEATLHVESSISNGEFISVSSGSTNVTNNTGSPLILHNNSATPGDFSSLFFYDANWNLQGSIGMMYGAHTATSQGTFYIDPRIVSTPSAFVVAPTGNVGIGMTSPGSKLEVNGNVKLTSGSGASLTFADGTVQSTAWTGSLCGGDYAESVDVTGERTEYEPGDVLVVDADHPGHFLKASERYSTLVAGIYSTKPGLVGRRQTTDPKTSTTEVPMAMVGVVPTKVSAENGPIKPGDLLVTSSTLGYAMKGTDRGLLTGAIVGKALGALSSGTGVIEVLVSLQ